MQRIMTTAALAAGLCLGLAAPAAQAQMQGSEQSGGFSVFAKAALYDGPNEVESYNPHALQPFDTSLGGLSVVKFEFTGHAELYYRAHTGDFSLLLATRMSGMRMQYGLELGGLRYALGEIAMPYKECVYAYACDFSDYAIQSFGGTLVGYYDDPALLAALSADAADLTPYFHFAYNGAFRAGAPCFVDFAVCGRPADLIDAFYDIGVYGTYRLAYEYKPFPVDNPNDNGGGGGNGGGPKDPGLVPEPSTWALLIVGFGLAGRSLRRAVRRGTLEAWG